MKNKKLMFKFTTIISFSIVIMLIINICMPLLAIADGEEEINIQLDYNSEAGTLNATGNITSTYTGYELYWVKGEVNFNSSSDANEVINWFKTNKIQEDIQNSLTINNTLSISESGTYTVLCIAKTNEQISMLKWVSKTITKPQEIQNTIKLELSSDGMKINIKVIDSAYDIKTIKIAKSDTTLLCKDFATIGENISFTGTKEVTVSKDVESAGQYFIFVENAAGAQYVNGIIIKDETATQNTIIINIAKLNSDNKTVHLNITSEKTKIKTIKYEITESVIKDKEEVKNNGVEISTDANAISVSDSQLSSYISIYVEDETGAYRFVSKNISALDSYDSLPWEEEYEELPDEETNQEENNENANQEQNKEENDENVNQEQNKEENDENVNQEQNKEENNENVNQEQNKEENNENVNQEQNKEENNENVNQEQNKEENNENVNQEQNKEENKDNVNQEQNKEENKDNANPEQNKNENSNINNVPQLNGGEATIEKIPQTGSSNTETLIAIFVFATIGILSFINYKKTEE